MAESSLFVIKKVLACFRECKGSFSNGFMIVTGRQKKLKVR